MSGIELIEIVLTPAVDTGLDGVLEGVEGFIIIALVLLSCIIDPLVLVFSIHAAHIRFKSMVLVVTWIVEHFSFPTEAHTAFEAGHLYRQNDQDDAPQ